VENNEEIKMAGEHTAAKSDCIPVPKAIAILGNEKRESTMAGFTTGANSTSPNANWLEESTMLIEEPIRATMGLGDKRDDELNLKGNVKELG